jgi:hypothetical protein
MDLKKLFLSTIAASIFLILINTVLFPLVFPDGPAQFYANAREKPLFLFNLLAYIATAFLLAYIYPIGYRGGSPRVEGIRFGMYMGLLVSLPHTFHVYATVDYAFYSAALVIAWTIVVWGAVGIVIALVHGSRKGESQNI